MALMKSFYVFFVSRALVMVYLYPYAQEMRVRSLLLLAGPALLVYYVLRRRVRMRTYCLFASHLEHSSFLLTLHCARIWEWGVAQEACTAVPGLLRQVRAYAWCSQYAWRTLALSSAVVSTLLSVR